MSFTAEHLELVVEVETYVEKWRPRLPWVPQWHITVAPHPDSDEGWRMRIVSSEFVRGAKIYVKPNPLDPEGFDLFPPGEFSLELVTVHELCHLLFADVRNQYAALMQGWGQAALDKIEQDEELMAWQIARSLIRTQTFCGEQQWKNTTMITLPSSKRSRDSSPNGKLVSHG